MEPFGAGLAYLALCAAFDVECEAQAATVGGLSTAARLDDLVWHALGRGFALALSFPAF